MVFKVDEKDGTSALAPRWLLVYIDVAGDTIIANGVIFVYGSGEETRQSHIDRAWNEPPESQPPVPATGPASTQSTTRFAGSRHAVLLSLDATGKQLWTSGTRSRMEPFQRHLRCQRQSVPGDL